jgi:hypothetical protein
VFVDDKLKEHLETSSAIKSQSLILAEWNLNSIENIEALGNYRYRPTGDINDRYKTIPNGFDVNDSGNFYTGATNSDITIDGGLNNSEEPLAFQSIREKEKSLYSLEDCVGKFRPRSGINKLRFFSNNFSHHTNIDMAKRPRYYMSDRNDTFKYWTSYRTEDGVERGVASKQINGQFYIDDAAPYVVYKKEVPANRLVIKMQTNVGSIDLGPFADSSGSFSDPFFGDSNKTTPIKWKVQVLKNNNWVDAKSFNQMSTRPDGTPVISQDGYVELSYGLIVPEKYQDNFKEIATLSSIDSLPSVSTDGHAYLIKENQLGIGTYYVWNSDIDSFENFIPTYEWHLHNEDVSTLTNFVTKISSPLSYIDPGTGYLAYREIDYISGIRIVVETMNKFDSTFDLIEMSPRLSADISDMTKNYRITKSASDLGISGMPVGQLLASTGTLSLFDPEQVFNSNNPLSVVNGYANRNMQVKFYESILDVVGSDGLTHDYYVPIKTLYSDSLPRINNSDRSVEIELRDMFFYFESLTAPQIFIQNASVSYAISLLLDNIGFSNYVFKRAPGEKDPVIPNFFVGPDRTVAEVLNDIAISTQTAMFFDEYNNLVMMTKQYMIPSEADRSTDLTLYGNDVIVSTSGKEILYAGSVSHVDQLPSSKIPGGFLVSLENAIYSWSDTASEWTLFGTFDRVINSSSIIDVESEENKIYNDGKINYTTRYIQKTYGSIKQASLVDREKDWTYKPALLWEVAGENNTKSINDELSDQSSYVLSAIPLNSNLSAQVPYVSGGKVQNNIMDLGEGVYWISRYNGYFYSNGEVIKYDAVQYNVPTVIGSEATGLGYIDNNVWISSVEEYQSYFSQISFNGKIYPTGLVRIYTEPNYKIINGVTVPQSIAKHGRGQFGTTVVEHKSGLDPYWADSKNLRGCSMKSSHLFSDEQVPATTTGAAGVNNSLASKTTCSGLVKNFMSSSYVSETELARLYSTQSGTIQSSALVMTGPSFSTTEKPLPKDFISYVYKPLTEKFRHFGTRMRIIGKIENNANRGQTPIGSTSYYVVNGSSPDQNININAASGGLAVMLNPETNNGYYFEIAALTENDPDSYTNSENIYNVIFYKVKKSAASGTTSSSEAIPVRLWAGLTQIVVDSGKFTGQSRINAEEVTTVYDLAVEYETIAGTRRFFLYINNNLVATVDDNDPLPIYNNMALFVRGSARCMFENIYAITNNYSKNTGYVLDSPINAAFGDTEINVNESFRKYAMSGMIQATYLSGIKPSEPPEYKMYFEEFGTIMREAAYFNIRYDKAYPALYAKLSPTYNNLKGYVTSGFIAGAYGAEFLIFNATDTALSLDESSGNYLRIQGVTFTQASSHDLTVDEYFSKNSDLSQTELIGSSTIKSPLIVEQEYIDIKNSRSTYGKKDFTLDLPYVQSHDDAESLMGWLISKVMKPRKAVGLKVFSMPTIQLGDIVKINYTAKTDFDQIADSDTRFVVYNIEFERSSDGPDMTIYLSEVF